MFVQVPMQGFAAKWLASFKDFPRARNPRVSTSTKSCGKWKTSEKPEATTDRLRRQNSTVRLYRPRKEILDGTWKFPDAQPMP